VAQKVSLIIIAIRYPSSKDLSRFFHRQLSTTVPAIDERIRGYFYNETRYINLRFTYLLTLRTMPIPSSQIRPDHIQRENHFKLY